MGQVGTKMRRVGPSRGLGDSGLAHWCPGCEEMHKFAIDGPNPNGAQWTWDGNVERPTFNPSMHIRSNAPDQQGYDPEFPTEVCHYFLHAGMIQYLGDCTHALVNQRVDLPDLPLRLRDF